MRGAKILTQVLLPKEDCQLSVPGSHLTVLDSRLPSVLILHVWVYGPKNAIDFNTLKGATERLLEDPNYAAVFTARYFKENDDGRWFRTDQGRDGHRGGGMVGEPLPFIKCEEISYL